MLGLITQRQITDKYGGQCDQLEKEYITFFEKLGLQILPVSNFQKPSIENVDIIILTGGGNINQEQPERDELEKFLFEQAINKKIPIIGICRGMQYINLLMGGNLSKNAELNIQRPNRIDHDVQIKNEIIKVNNYHNDVIFIPDLAKDLNILATDEENNTVEAFYKKGILGIQWHPERLFQNKESEEYSTNLIEDFIQNNGEIK